MKRLITAVVFTLLFSASTLAGEIPSGDFVAPSPPNRPASTSSQGQTIVPDQGTGDTQEATLDAAQTALLTILSLLVY